MGGVVCGVQDTLYKYDVLYELIDMDEAQYDSYETEINELKARRDDYISKQNIINVFSDFNSEYIKCMNRKYEMLSRVWKLSW